MEFLCRDSEILFCHFMPGNLLTRWIGTSAMLDRKHQLSVVFLLERNIAALALHASITHRGLRHAALKLMHEYHTRG